MKATDGLIQGLEETIKATASKVEETEATVGELEAALQDKYPNMELAKHRFTARTYGSNPTPERCAPTSPQASLPSLPTVNPPLPSVTAFLVLAVLRAGLLSAPLPQPHTLTPRRRRRRARCWEQPAIGANGGPGASVAAQRVQLLG